MISRPEAAALEIIVPETIAVPGGWFTLGSAESGGRDEEHPARRVWVDAFEMARCQVTNREYAAFLAATHRPPPPLWTEKAFSAPDQPVAGPNWFDAVAYCEWLSRETGLPFRLPAEAEWECAARGGADGCQYPWGDEPPSSRPDYSSRWLNGPELVGTSPPNAFGLFDLCENVHEWCLDWYDPGFYPVLAERNPLCERPGTAPPRRSSRGGSWRHHIKISRCATRSAIPPGLHYADYGFRVIRSELQFDQLKAE